MVASISWPQSAIEFWFVKVVPKYLNSSTLSKVLLSILTLWIRPAFWFRDMTMYLVLSALTSSPISLVAAVGFLQPRITMQGTTNIKSHCWYSSVIFVWSLPLLIVAITDNSHFWTSCWKPSVHIDIFIRLYTPKQIAVRLLGMPNRKLAFFLSLPTCLTADPWKWAGRMNMYKNRERLAISSAGLNDTQNMQCLYV